MQVAGPLDPEVPDQPDVPEAPLLPAAPLLLLAAPLDDDKDEPDEPLSTSWLLAPEHAVASTLVQVSETPRGR
jgi:hypothetical protein